MENKKIIAAFVQLWMKYPTGEREILIDLTCRELGITRAQLFEALTEVSL
jgi:hypothetical protein